MPAFSELDALADQVTLGLNSEQTEFYRKATKLEFSKMLLTGEAGAGKTYVLTAALAQLHRMGHKVVLCAPTHLARVNLLAKMPEDIRHEVETKTTASILSRFGFNTDTGGVGFSGPKADRLGGYDVIAIDEASMIGLADYEVLKSAPCKVIFTGDFKQLPAIMQKAANMAEDPDLEQIHLEEQMRAPGVIHQLAERNRTEVYFPTEDAYDDNSKVVVHRTTQELVQQMISDISADARGADAHPHYRFITLKNSEVYRVGTHVRNAVIGKSEPITAGEWLLNYETCPAAYNGEVVKVVNVVPDVAASHDKMWDSYKIEVEGSRGVCWVNIINPTQLPVLEAHLASLQDLLDEAIKRKAFDASKSYLDEIKHITTYWTKMFYTFAMTTHKSQGQTIESVYVDTPAYAKASNKRALLYVGLSRAAKALHTVIVHPPAWVGIRAINTAYKAAKAEYETLFAEPHWKVRVRTGLPAKTPEQKKHLTEVIEGFNADAQQILSEAESPVTPEFLRQIVFEC